MKKYILIILIALPFIMSAQPGAGEPPGSGSPVPIGFTEVLLLGGAALGAAKIRKAEKMKD